MALVLFCKHSSHIKALEAEIAWLRLQCTHERQRAEVAIDHLLALKVGVTPVTRPTREEVQAYEHDIERTLRDPEFTQAGNAE